MKKEFNPKDADVQTVIDMLKQSDQGEDEILETLVEELDLTEEQAIAALEANEG